MTADEWVEKRVADLVVGDEVKDWYGSVSHVKVLVHGHSMLVDFSDGSTFTWPAGGRVDVRRPAEVTVSPVEGAYAIKRGYIYIDGKYVGHLVLDHAEEYAERLRGSADGRREALGQ